MKPSNNNLEQRIEEYKKLYPGKTLYFTPDGNCFLDKSPCVDHANKTKQKWVEVKPDEKPVVEDKDLTMTAETAKELLLTTEVTDGMDYQVAKELVKVLGLKPVSNKKDDLLVALEEYKIEVTKPVDPVE